MARDSAITKYLAEIGRKGGKASGKALMEKLTPEKRAAVAKNAAAARWAKPVTQADLQRQAALQADERSAGRAAQTGAEKIRPGLAEGTPVAPGEPTFDKKLIITAEKTNARVKVLAIPSKKNKVRS
jgi:hypothetical protein